MSRLGQRTPWIAGAVIVAAVLLAGRIDLAHTEDQIPPVPPLCVPDTIECNNARSAKFGPRLDEIRRLDHDFDRRAWLYGGIAAVAMGLATAFALARSPSLVGHRRVFADAGVAGVVLGLTGIGVLWAAGREISPPIGAVLLPCMTLIAVAGLGGSVARAQSPPAEEAAVEPAAAEGPSLGRCRRVALAALFCTGLTVVLAWAFAAPQNGSCDMPSSAPAWTTAFAWAAVATAGTAGVLALIGLAARRWAIALLCFVVNPAALLYMLLSTGVAC
jgi:hypothetical protein